MSDYNISILILLIAVLSLCRAIDNDSDDDDEETEVCDLPIDEGDCSSADSISDSDEENIASTVYGYNSNTTKCEEFIYEGCDGNRNRFDNANDCWKACYTPLKYFLARVTHLLTADTNTK